MTLELEQTLQGRLDEANAEKVARLAKIKELNTNLQSKLKKLPKRPRETVKELEDKEKKLEHKRTVTSISLAEERQILKEINVVKKTKMKVEEFIKAENEVQSMKKQLSDLRNGMNDIFAATDEIQSALDKVKLANKLECSTDELSTKKLTCPKAKLGMVIGKNGSMIKQIQKTCKVSIQVEQTTDEITITGSEASIERATTEIENIIRAEEEKIQLEKILLDYLTSKYVHVIRKLREEYSSSFVDVQRSDGNLIIQGSPEDFAKIKATIFGEPIVVKKRPLAGREAQIIVGKKGATIERLCTEHEIPIEVGKDESTETSAVFTGPPEAVEGALSDVEKLLHDNKEVKETIDINLVQKNILLADGGRHIKGIQAKLFEAIPDGHCYVSVNSDVRTKDRPEVLVRAKQIFISDALQFTIGALKEFDKLFVTCTIDPYIAPRIIGKGGETIKKLTGGKPFFLDLDKISGELSYGATSAEGLETLRKRVEEIIDSNSVIRVKADSAILKRQYRELNRSQMKKDMNGICRFDIDENDSCYVVRGKKEDLQKAKLLLDEFISNNQFEEIPITDEDREALLNGGKKSKIAHFSEQLDVNLQVDRSNLCLVLRGSRENVDKSAKTLNQFLNGGNGFSVMRFTLNEQVVGKVIGRGGKMRQQLEERNEGVTINISRAHVVTIRGPTQAVSSCRVEIAKMVASARISQSVSISGEQKASLEKKDFTKKIYQQTPVNITTTNDKIVVKGTFHDVRDAVSLLNEILTGEYNTAIELDASQFSKLRNAVRDPSHFARMESTCGAKLELDLTAGSISIIGKRSQVKRAKDQVYGFLDFLFPNQLVRLKITKPLFQSVGKASVLAEISAEAGGVAVYLDRDLSLVVIRSIDEEKAKKATALIKSKIAEAERLAFVFEISASDSWILPVIIGKRGENVSILRKKYSGCKIDISKESRTITIVGESDKTVEAVREEITAAIEKARSENIFVTIQNTDIPSFLGKGGSHVKELSAQYEVAIQSVKKGNSTGTYKISGEALKVKTAKEAIETWIDMREKANAILEMTLEREQDIPAILGQKGAIARSIEEDYKCRFDIDKKSLVVKIKGPNEEQREGALIKMKELIETYRKEKVARELAAKEERENAYTAHSANGENGTRSIKASSHSFESEIIVSDTKVVENDVNRNQFPSKPVGIATKSLKNGHGKKKKVDTSVNEGTEAGKSLFAMLLTSDD